ASNPKRTTPSTRICHRSMPVRPVAFLPPKTRASKSARISALSVACIQIHWRAARMGGSSSRLLSGRRIFSMGVIGKSGSGLKRWRINLCLRLCIAYICSLYASQIFANLRSANPTDPNPTHQARSPARGYDAPPVPTTQASARGLLPAQLHLSDEESHRICAQARGRDRPQRNRGLPALQKTHRPMDRSGLAALPLAHAVGALSPFPIQTCQGGLPTESCALKARKPWKIPLSHHPLN